MTNRKIFGRAGAKIQRRRAFAAIFLQETGKKDFHYNPSRGF